MTWTTWEDWRAGMYDNRLDARQIEASRRLLAGQEFGDAASAMLTSWPVAARQNLYYMWSGRNAWVGHATCAHRHGSTKMETCAAWGQLTSAQQDRANVTAARSRHQWEVMANGQATLDLRCA